MSSDSDRTDRPTKTKNFKTEVTGKSFSEALILESVNPQYDERLFIELQE